MISGPPVETPKRHRILYEGSVSSDFAMQQDKWHCLLSYEVKYLSNCYIVLQYGKTIYRIDSAWFMCLLKCSWLSMQFNLKYSSNNELSLSDFL